MRSEGSCSDINVSEGRCKYIWQTTCMLDRDYMGYLEKSLEPSC